LAGRPCPAPPSRSRDRVEPLDDRHGRRATLITNQLPVEHWHDLIADPTLADAILDRLVHNAYRITLKGGSMGKRHARTLTPTGSAEYQRTPASLRSDRPGRMLVKQVPEWLGMRVHLRRLQLRVL
jgi:hypothetical protein